MRLVSRLVSQLVGWLVGWLVGIRTIGGSFSATAISSSRSKIASGFGSCVVTYVCICVHVCTYVYVRMYVLCICMYALCMCMYVCATYVRPCVHALLRYIRESYVGEAQGSGQKNLIKINKNFLVQLAHS